MQGSNSKNYGKVDIKTFYNASYSIVNIYYSKILVESKLQTV